MRAVLLLVCGLLAAAAGPGPVDAGCGAAVAAAERAYANAPGLLAAIATVESGRFDRRAGVRLAWPWTVTAEGVGTYYPGKSDAIAAVRLLQARGVQSIDVGCLQVNLLYHPTAFRDLDQAFDPAANALYAARFLSGLHARLGTWPAAAAGYHSLTPALGAQYRQLVAAVWAGAPVPTATGPGGMEIVRFPGGGQLRIERDLVEGGGRVSGVLLGP